MIPPTLGYQSIFFDNRAWLRGSSELTAAALVANLQRGNFWGPTAADWAGGVAYLYCYPVLGQLLPLNWYFRDWSAGASASPDGWTLSGAGAAIARGTTSPKVGAYNAVLTRSGADCCIYQAVVDATALRGLQVSGGAWATCGTGSRAYAAIYDGSTRWTSSAHSGGGTAEWLSVSSGAIAATATSVVLELWVKTGNVAATFEGALLLRGASAAATPHAVSCDYLALAGHRASSGSYAISVQTSANNFGAATTVATIAPTSDGPAWRTFGPAFSAYWRVAVAPVNTYSTLPTLEVVNLGLAQRMPRGLLSGFDPGAVHPVVESGSTAAGYALGRLVRQLERPCTLTVPYATEAELSALLPFRSHAITGAWPFFVAWDLSEHPGDVLFAWTDDGATWDTGRERSAKGLITRALSLSLKAVAE